MEITESFLTRFYRGLVRHTGGKPVYLLLVFLLFLAVTIVFIWGT